MAFLDLLETYLSDMDARTRKIISAVIFEEQRFIDMDKPNLKTRIREIIDEAALELDAGS